MIRPLGYYAAVFLGIMIVALPIFDFGMHSGWLNANVLAVTTAAGGTLASYFVARLLASRNA
jgi:hypothetical protein